MATWLEMAGASKSNNGGVAHVEWKVNVGKSSSDDGLVAEEAGVGVAKRMHGQIMQCLVKIGVFFDKAREIAATEPKKVIHCVKVGIALSLVSLLYYMRPLYDGVGGNAMWAVMTVVVALEYSVGATIAKSFNRVGATFLAGSIGLGVHWMANQCGHQLEPLVLQLSIFIVASVATFSRFIPSVKARFDYGAMIFILTFSFVSMSGYRVDKLLDLARNRVSTIAIGTSLCILTSMFFYPVWAGKDLHDLIYQNLEKLADSLDGCVTDYFNGESFDRKLEGYKCVLNSKATEVAKANFARWEPAHGPFKYGHPWKQYLKIGASMRTCAYCIETLRGYISSEVSGMQVPELLKDHMKEICMTLSSSSSKVLRELAITMESMRKSTKTDILVHEMNFAVETFQNVLKDLSNQAVVLVPTTTTTTTTTVSNEENSRNCKPEPELVPIMKIFPMATMASLLIEIAERVEGIVVQVEEMAAQAQFDNFVVINNTKKNKGTKPSNHHHHHVDVIITSFQYRLAL
ncbi:aluminum-activated malate transporter 10 [Lactuca sativa]|uniref:aluminum-activated malate transporter 10 n=1 Tax=Lactuca sativa TaxID=4236 RepID=UPI000CC841B9|nr:aluminum-activated malate transporter 10 [Lactuca sativa]